jgi:hypothetical protein
LPSPSLVPVQPENVARRNHASRSIFGLGVAFRPWTTRDVQICKRARRKCKDRCFCCERICPIRRKLQTADDPIDAKTIRRRSRCMHHSAVWLPDRDSKACRIAFSRSGHLRIRGRQTTSKFAVNQLSDVRPRRCEVKDLRTSRLTSSTICQRIWQLPFLSRALAPATL